MPAGAPDEEVAAFGLLQSADLVEQVGAGDDHGRIPRQTLLGHATPAMARRYAGQALNHKGAKLMVQYSPLS